MNWKNDEWQILIKKVAIAQSLMGWKKSFGSRKDFRGSTRIESPIGNANGESIESLAKRMERQAKKVKEDYGKMEITIDRIQDESKSVQEVIDKLQIQ